MASIRIAEFDTWRPGYGLASVRVLKAGTNTLADIFTDEDLTTPAANPQTLIERVIDDASYGRFSAPLYVGVAYQLRINSVDRTGVERVPIYTLDGADASAALVRVTDGSRDIALADHLARAIDVRDYGIFLASNQVGASASTNNASLTEALGVAGARGAAYVDVPAGTFLVTNFTVPLGVVVRGQGRGATVLQSTQAGKVATLGGARSGFGRITLDGVTLVGNSVGVYAENIDQIVFDDVEIKRFETGLHRKGGKLSFWRELYISNCVDGYLAHGDLASGVGGLLRFNEWDGGKIELCSGTGAELKNIDAQCTHQEFANVGFDSNEADAIHIIGARAITLRDCWWTDNAKNLVVEDGDPATADNTVIGLEVVGGSMIGGTLELSDTLEQVALRRLTMQSVTVTLTTPANNVLVEDCREVSGMSFAGVATAWLRRKTGDRGNTGGVTAGNTPTKAWAIALDPGQRVSLTAKVVGRGRNVTDDAFFHIAAYGKRLGASLAYDTQTGNFTVGNTLTGATSGATGRITADTDAGATGTLTLQDVVGTFVDNEIIGDGGTGSATANGALSTTDAKLAGSTCTMTIASPAVVTRAGHRRRADDFVVFNNTGGALPTGVTAGATYYVIAAGLSADAFEFSATKGGSAVNSSGAQSGTHTVAFVSNLQDPEASDSGFLAMFVASGPEIELRVTGATSKTMEWTTDVDVVSS